MGQAQVKNVGGRLSLQAMTEGGVDCQRSCNVLRSTLEKMDKTMKRSLVVRRPFAFKMCQDAKDGA